MPIESIPLEPVHTDLGDLKRKSVRGGAITFASQGAGVAIQLVSTVILARLLSPADYGVVAMVVAVTSFAGLFRDLGLSASAIQKQTLTHAQQSNLFWINVALGIALTTLLAAASPLVAWFYGKPEVQWVTVAMSASFVIGSLSAQSGALLVRQMRYGRQATSGVAGGVMTLAVSVVLARNGARYGALVWGQLTGALTTTTLLFLLSPFRPGFPSRGTGLKAMFKFGVSITLFDLVNYFHRNLDNILIGRFWGGETLGLYSRAYSLLMFPINNLRGPISAVGFPAMSRLQSQPAALRAYYLRVTSLIAALSMPLTAFLFVTASPVVELLLGRQWLSAAPIFSYLALAAFVQPASGFAGSLLMSMGQGRRYVQCGIFNTTVLCVCFVAGLPWGGVGVAIAYTVGNYIILYPWLFWAFRGSSISFTDFASVCAFPAAVSLAAGALVWLIESNVEGLPPSGQITVCGAAFMLIVTLAALCTTEGRAQVAYIVETVKQLRKS